MSDLEPITQEETAWANGKLEPVTRKEQYLNRLAGEEQAIPETPITRIEQYLARLCGMETEIPSSPITREEAYLAYLNGEDVILPEPITRLERFMAFAAGESETKPTPLTREEFYWDKYQGGAVLKDFPGLPASIVTVTDAIAKPLDSLKVAITPVQEGSGDPSPDNIRPISGWTGANIYNSADVNFDADGNIVIESTQAGSGDPSPTNIRPITAGLSLLMDDSSTLDVYGGYLDVKSRVLTVTDASVDLGSKTWIRTDNSTSDVGYTFYTGVTGGKNGDLSRKVTCYKFIDDALGLSNIVDKYGSAVDKIAFSTSTTTRLCVIDGDYTDADTFKESLDGQYLVYELAIPHTYQLSQTEFARALTALGIPTTEISFGEAGTVYSGTLDVTNGVLTVTNVIKTFSGDASEEWSALPVEGAFLLENCFVGAPSNMKTSTNSPVCLCNMYKESSSIQSSASMADKENNVFCNQVRGEYYKRLFIKDTRFTDVNDFTQMLSSQNLKVVYPLATPITYQLTPTEVQMLLGTNNLWADTGDILEGKYWGKKSSATRAMLNTLRSAREITEITPTEEPEESDER